MIKIKTISIFITLSLITSCNENNTTNSDTNNGSYSFNYGSYKFNQVTVYMNDSCDGQGYTGLCNYSSSNSESTLYSQNECNAISGSWTTLLELFQLEDSYAIINSDNSFIYPDCELGTYSVDSNLITVSDYDCNGFQNSSSLTDSTSCVDAGGAWEEEIETAIITSNTTVLLNEVIDIPQFNAYSDKQCVEYVVSFDSNHDGSCGN
jgi:hypothetical protein